MYLSEQSGGFMAPSVYSKENLLKRVLREFCLKYQLSKREAEVLKLLVTKTVTAKEVASSLSISVNTARIHFQNIFLKLRVTSKTEVLGSFVDFMLEDRVRN